jgi:hypothetical protein
MPISSDNYIKFYKPDIQLQKFSALLVKEKLKMLNVHQNLNTSEFELKLNEAETCHSMGLFNEALSI